MANDLPQRPGLGRHLLRRAEARVRARMHKLRQDLGDQLDKLSAKVKAKGETFNGGAAHG